MQPLTSYHSTTFYMEFIHHYLVYLLFTLLAVQLLSVLGKGIATLNFIQEKKEADFQYGLMRVHENAESIAFYGAWVELNSWLRHCDRRAQVLCLQQISLRNRPLKFVTAEYNGSLPSLVYHPYSWTKWLVEHPQFISNPLYIVGDSYAGKIVPMVAKRILDGIDEGKEPLLNLQMRNVAEEQIRWRLGEGHINFWFDTLLDAGPLFKLCNMVGDPGRSVSSMWDEQGWVLLKLREVLTPDLVVKALDVYILRGEPDLQIWKLSLDGAFSSKSAWRLIRQTHQVDGICFCERRRKEKLGGRRNQKRLQFRRCTGCLEDAQVEKTCSNKT
ncbi:hypothetical protein ZIOFF_070314 [Zingiber officinale]|uniref:ABC transmembrane type-1 domain-containing protein n=1 Tax=Zingiber officinale TaxID=94328 RepID=A0A8J5EUF9_ZINOF|nr:hypothetical protein ZIOFF_070314 [Zingiber officinale]